MQGIIYKWISPSNKVYIGKDSTGKRKEKFLIQTNPYTSPDWSSKIDRARKKYKVINFKYEIIETIEAETYEDLNHLLSDAEIYWINYYDSYNSGYNSTLGGEGMSGFHHTLETRLKQREAKLNRRLPEEQKKKIRENAINKKAVYQCDINGNILAEYPSVGEASRATGINKNTIIYQAKHCTNSNKNKHGYTWRYVKASNNIPSNNAIKNDTENKQRE